MRLLCVIPSYWPAVQFGGPVITVHTLNKNLVKKGIDITVYTTNVGLDTTSMSGSVQYRTYDTRWDAEIDGVKVTYFFYTKLFDLFAETGWQFSLPMAKALNNNIKDFDIVYIVSTWNFPVALGAYFCRKYKIPYIISPRGQLYNEVFKNKFIKKSLYHFFILKRDLQNASAIHYTTEDEAEQCHKALGLNNRYFVVPNGIDLTEITTPYEKGRLIEKFPHLKGKRIILFLGRINWKKGLDLLIKAFFRLAKEYNDVHLLIVGDDDGDGYKKKVEKWIIDHGIKDEVTFTGRLTGRDKFDAFACADIFVLPSYSENFGMAVVEAMACGIPVVISNRVGIYKEVKKNQAGVVINTNVEELHEGIKRLLENSHLRKSVAENGKKLVEEYYSIDKVADKMIEEYRRILR